MRLRSVCDLEMIEKIRGRDLRGKNFVCLLDVFCPYWRMIWQELPAFQTGCESAIRLIAEG